VVKAAGAPKHEARQIVDLNGEPVGAKVLTREELLTIGPVAGPALLIDAEATAYMPSRWNAVARDDGAVVVTMKESDLS
jgi:hypothetical protein